MKPKVWPWFLVYIGSLALAYLACVVGGVALAVLGGSTFEGGEATEAVLVGVILAGTGLPFLLGTIVAPFLPRKKWVWVYNIILIALGMGSCLWMPLSLYLLIKFVEPDVKNYFDA